MKIVDRVAQSYPFKRTGGEADTESGFPASHSLDCIFFYLFPLFSLGCPTIWDKLPLNLREISPTNI